MNKKMIILWLLLIYILLTGGVEAAAHKTIPCDGCHGLLGVNPGDKDKGGCHRYKLDVAKLEKEHNPNICKGCHMGNTLADASDKDIFHNGHNAVKCTRCHTEDNFTVIKIKNDGFKCVSCHGSKIHTIHIKNIDKACPICHGTWANDKSYNTQSNSPSSNKTKENENFEKFTIFSLIKNLFDYLLGKR